MSDVYQELAKKLNELPQGFPRTESGVELRILKKLFRPEDAAVALKLMPWGLPAEKIGESLDKTGEEMQPILDDMAKRGQIGSATSRGRQYYMLSPFVPGIYEYQVYRLDKELVEMFEEYLPTLTKTLGGFKPGLARTIPVNAAIEVGKQVHSYEEVRGMLDQAASFKVMDCICRKEQDIDGQTCDHTLENCLNFSREENAYDYFSLGGRVISKDEAIQVLDAAAEEGLVHNAFYNVKSSHGAICNCCSCCCLAIRGLKDFDAPHMIAKSNFVAAIDQDECSECGVCADERCPMDAIEEDSGYEVQPDRCIGCGVCTITCPTEAITLISRSESDQEQPADNMKDWSNKRIANRAKAAKG